MADNGTLLARQMRRFVEKFPPTYKILANVEATAIEAIKKLGNPEYFEDESEKILPIPIEFHQKRPFDSAYKKLQKEYPDLPDLAKAGQQKAADKAAADKAAADKAAADKAAADKAAADKAAADKAAADKAAADKAAADKAAADKAAADKAAADKAAADKAAADKAAADKVAADKAGADKAAVDKAAADKAATDKATVDKAAADKAAADKAKEIHELLERLKSLGVDDTVIQKSQGSRKSPSQDSRDSTVTSHGSRESSVASQASSKTSVHGSREASAESTRSWNTRAGSTDSSLQISGRWRKVREKLGSDESHQLATIAAVAQENDCDYTDVLFFLEFCLRRDPDITVAELTDFAIQFITDAPNSQSEFRKNLPEKDPQLQRAYDRYYAGERPGETKARAWARNPQAYRDEILEGLPYEEGWDRITLTEDPDTGEKEVEGRITGSTFRFLDVCLPSLKDNNEERHVMVPKSRYSGATRRFEGCERGQKLTVNSQPKDSLCDRDKSDFKILNYSCARQIHPDIYPRINFWGIDIKNRKILKTWPQSYWCGTGGEFATGIDDVNDQRRECGQEEIFKVPRPHKKWPTKSNAGWNSDDDLADDLDKLKI